MADERPQKIEGISTSPAFGLAVEEFRKCRRDGLNAGDCDFSAIAAEGEKAAEELASAPGARAYAEFLAGYAHRRLCEETGNQEQCTASHALFESAQKNATACQDGVGFIVTRGSGEKTVGKDYDCAAIQRAAAFFSSHPMQEKGKGPAEKHRVTNFRIGLNFGLNLLHNNSKYDPPIPFPLYLRTSVLDTYNPRTNEWSSNPNLYQYNRTVTATHSFEGPVHSTSKGHLYLLPVPYDFEVDAKSVEVDGRKDGFAILTDNAGHVYVRTEERFFFRPQIKFRMGAGEHSLLATRPPAANIDIITDSDIPPRISDFLKSCRFLDDGNKFRAVESFVRANLAYPDAIDAIFSAWQGSGKSFLSAISGSEKADCDTANSVAVILLNKLNVPARLALGFLIDERGTGGHGWLEYFDERKQMWVMGDVTPAPIDKSKNTPDTILTALRKGTATIRVMELPKKRVMNYPRTTSPLPTDPKEFTEKVDVYWNSHYPRVLSQPTGRYGMTGFSNNFNTLNLWDYEHEKEIAVPFPQEGYPIKEIIETASGFVIVYTKEIFDTERWDYYKIFNESGASLHNGVTSGVLWVSKFEPHVRWLWFMSSRWHSTRHEDSQGRLHLLTVDGLYRMIEPNSTGQTEFIIDNDYDNPFQKVLDASLAGGGSSAKFEIDADGSHKIFYTDNGPAVVYEGNRKLYEIPPMKHSNDWSMVSQKFRFNPDHSIEVRSDFIPTSNPKGERHTELHHINPDGKEDESRRIAIEVTDMLPPAGAFIAVTILSHTFFQTLPKETNLSNVYISDDGQTITLEFSADSKKGMLTTLRLYKGNAGEVLIKEDAKDEFDFEPLHCGQTIPACLICGGNSFMYQGQQFRTEIQSQFRTNAPYWSAWSHAPHKLSNTLPYDDLVIHNREDPAVFILKEILRSENYELTEEDKVPSNRMANLASYSPLKTKRRGDRFPVNIMFALASIASRENVYLQNDWLLISTALLFGMWSGFKDENRQNSDTNRRLEDFIRKHGFPLTQRFEEHIKDGALFPNSELVAKSWAFFITALFKQMDAQYCRTVIGKMIAADPKIFADAIINVIESGSVDADELARFFASERGIQIPEKMILDESLRKSLRERKKLAIHSMGQVAFSRMAEWGRYQYLEQTIADTFGADAIPAQIEKDW